MPAFWIGVAMVAFDGLGHGVAAFARITGRGDLWNKYSPLIWPVLMDDKIRDIYWAVWFATAIVLIIVGHFSAGDRSPRISSSVLQFDNNEFGGVRWHNGIKECMRPSDYTWRICEDDNKELPK